MVNALQKCQPVSNSKIMTLCKAFDQAHYASSKVKFPIPSHTIPNPDDDDDISIPNPLIPPMCDIFWKSESKIGRPWGS